MGWLLLGLLALALVAWGLAFARPHTAVDVAGGRAVLVRGAPPAGLLRELEDVARAAPNARGRIELSGGGDALHVRISGLDAGFEQRVRNVVGMYAARIRG